MNISELTNKIQWLKREAKHWQEILDRRSCDTCQHIALSPPHPHRVCKLAPDFDVPEEVFKRGCPQWVFDDVPF